MVRRSGVGKPVSVLVWGFFFFFNCDEIANLHPETKIKWREGLPLWVVFFGRLEGGVGWSRRVRLATFPIG